jgi:hypothetical protein
MNNNFIIGRDGTVLECVELEKYLIWKKSFYEDEVKSSNLRLGQAFLNYFYPGVSMPRLYYEENVNIAEKIIYESFLSIYEEKV